MNFSIKTKKTPEIKARLALRAGKWKTALPYYEEQVHADEQDFAQWNLLGDIQYGSGDVNGASVSWQRALDGFAQESLHENVLGIGRKMVKRCPEETGVHLVISEAYLGLDYFADAISAFRSFTKLAKHATSTEIKSWFRKVISCEIRQPHLLEELTQLLDECKLEDIELERDLQAYVSRMQIQPEREEAEEQPVMFEVPEQETNSSAEQSDDDGMQSLDADWNSGDITFVQHDTPAYSQANGSFGDTPVSPIEFEVPETSEEEDLPAGQGKDHYDLGVVYAEMKLWDAAITEFQTARRDRTLRSKATIELAQCFKNSNDPHRALRLLEEETAVVDAESDVQDELNYHMGVLNEMLGNTDAALSCLERVGAGSGFESDAATLISRLRAAQ
ncbi:MAG: hypothetical protein KDB65_00320 [Calditrichaeota bacterium]|nr:hypothetical protein [Calditrichota bacterium]MCB9368528.1 hypothetical protein [Calditrichota bacterium]